MASKSIFNAVPVTFFRPVIRIIDNASKATLIVFKRLIEINISTVTILLKIFL